MRKSVSATHGQTGRRADRSVAVRGLRARWAARLATAAAVLLLPAGAVAHTEIQGSVPRNESRLARAPQTVVVDYSAPLAAVVEARVSVGGEEVAGGARLSPTDAGRVRIPIAAEDRTGRFSARWVVRSADNHLLEGSISFTVAGAGPTTLIALIIRALLSSADALAAVSSAARAPAA